MTAPIIVPTIPVPTSLAERRDIAPRRSATGVCLPDATVDLGIDIFRRVLKGGIKRNPHSDRDMDLMTSIALRDHRGHLRKGQH